jgi:hypothetical protein
MRDNLNYEASRIDYDDLELDMPRSSAGTWAVILGVMAFWIFVAMSIRWMLL